MSGKETPPTGPEQPHTGWEKIHIQREHLAERVKDLIHEGNVHCLFIKHKGQIEVELPATVGVVGAVVAPMLAAVGAIGAIVTHCTIEVVRRELM